MDMDTDTNTGGRMEHWSLRQRACVAQLLLCIWRLKRRGDVVAMDPAVLEEMLEMVPKVCMCIRCLLLMLLMLMLMHNRR